MEGDQFAKHFHDLGKSLSYLCCFTYKREVLTNPIGHHRYKWSKSMFALNLFVHSIIYIFAYYNFSYNFKVESFNLLVFIVTYVYAGLCFLLAFLEQDLLTDLILQIQTFDEQRKVTFYQFKSLYNKYYDKFVVSAPSLTIILLLFYLGVGFFWSGPINKLSVYLFIIIVVLSSPTLPYTVLVVYFSYEIALRYKSLYKYFLNELSSVNKNCHEKFLDKYRLLFFQLSRVQYKFNVCFGSKTMIFYCHTYLMLLCFMRTSLEVNLYPLILFLILKVLFEVYLTASFAGQITIESNSMLSVLCCLPTSNLSIRSQSQVHLFVLQIQISDQGVSAANYFGVNKATVISMLTCVTAYFPLLINFITITRSDI